MPPLRFLVIDGTGDPNTAASYSQAVETLYPVAYALKFASNFRLQKDYVVPPLEGRATGGYPAVDGERRRANFLP